MSERSWRESNGGGGGNRTRVREGSYGSFYTFSALVFYLAGAPLSGKWRVGQPVRFVQRLRASPPDYPDMSSPRRIASGRATRETSQSIKLRVRSRCCRLFLAHLINEEWTLDVLLSPLLFPSKPVRPRGVQLPL